MPSYPQTAIETIAQRVGDLSIMDSNELVHQISTYEKCPSFSPADAGVYALLSHELLRRRGL